jgi:Zn-dependent alcohol dehydrogenase
MFMLVRPAARMGSGCAQHQSFQNLSRAKRRTAGTSFDKTRTSPLWDFPLRAQAYLDGKLKLDELIIGHIKLHEANKGLDDLRAGSSIHGSSNSRE